MSSSKQTKINRLLQSQPTGTVFLSSWLTKHGYSHDLLQRYRKSGWLTSIGSGAMIRTGEDIGYEGALYTLQEQAGLQIHVGARTALSLLGRAHYLYFNLTNVFTFTDCGIQLPAWFLNYNWGYGIKHINTSFLPAGLGLTSVAHKNFSFEISGPERAIMECLYLTPKIYSFIESFELMEGLNNLRPNQVQHLLEQCTSIRVKRLFLYMAEKADHDWLNYIDIEKIDLGSGKRALLKDGIFIPKYSITVPKELAL